MGRSRISGKPDVPPPFYTPPILPPNRMDPEIPHPDVSDRTSAGQESREIILPGVDDGPRYIAYGKQRIAGKLQYVYFHASSGTMWGVIELCAGECDGLIDLTLDDGRPWPAGFMNYWWYPGTPTGALNANLAAVDTSWNETFPNTCYAVVALPGWGSYWTSWPNLRWYQRCRKPLNPDTGTRIYSENTWDHWYDYVLWSEGKAMPSARVDTPSFVAAKAADIAAGINTSSHLLLMQDTSPDDVIKTFRLMTRSFWVPDRNKYRVVADRAIASSATYTNDHVSRSVPCRGDRTDPFDRPNKVVIWYTDTANDWQLKDRSIQTAAVTAGTEDEIVEEHRIPHLHDEGVVDSLLTYLLYSRIYDAHIQERWLASTGDRQLGDRVTRQITPRGLTYDGRLLRRTIGANNTYDVELLEYNAAKFASIVASGSSKIPSTFPDPGAAPANVDAAGVTITEEAFALQPGDVKTRARMTWTNPSSAFFDHAEIWVSINGGEYRYFDKAPSGAGVAVTFLFDGIMEVPATYTFKFISVSIYLVKSSGSTKAAT
ncbi:MAG TPA: hypothetical protein VN181_07715, partial [Thermoanaerobaculia bacterium]|nr:hypothetical protein [Thermoanaerobaculia bacterium]